MQSLNEGLTITQFGLDSAEVGHRIEAVGDSGEGVKRQPLDRLALLVQGLRLDGRQERLSRSSPLLDGAKTGLKPGGEGLAAVTGDALHDFVDAAVRSDAKADGALGHPAGE
jgi:hypothetical protein